MILRSAILAIGITCLANSSVQAQNKPYPQAITYANCIKPSNVTQAAMNTSVASYYDYWKAKYVKTLTTLSGGYYIKGEISGDAEGYTPLGSSEGQGYGMVITVLMAGYDTNAKTIFDGLFKTARAFHSSINTNLMGWVVADATGAQGHFDSATDGDMDIAYALILAHYQWGSSGTINYLNEAKKIITNGLKVANVTSTNRLNLGDWDSKSALNTRPSDWMLSHMRAFYQETGDVTWLNLINNLYTVYNQFTATYSANTGLISDFVVKNPPEPAPQNYIDEGPQTNEYNYNACRVPLRVVMDYALYGSSSAYTLANKMASWIITKSGGTPSNIKDGYKLDGTTTGSDPEAVFVAPFVAAAVVNSSNQSFLNSGWTYLTTKKSGYYSDSYSLLCQLFISGNWWKPEATASTCVPVSASSDDGNVAANAQDGSLDTRWSATGDGQYLQFCLNAATTVTGADIAFYQGNTRVASFDIQTSTDGSSWTNAATGLKSSGTSLALETFTFSPVTAKYVRILGHGNNVNAWNSITEVQLKTGGNALAASKDAYVRNGSYGDDTYGSSDPTLLMTKTNTATTTGYDRVTYIGFDLSSITAAISTVTLKLYGKLDDSRAANVPVSVYSVSNTSWSENTLTWNNKPATGSAIATTTVTDSIGKYYSWDITAYAKSEKAAGRNTISLALVNGSITEPRITFNSKEAGSNTPQLIVSTTAAKQVVATEKLSVLNAYPNPFSQSMTVQFTLQEAGQTSLVLYAIDGHPVKVLANEKLNAGMHTRNINGTSLPAGIYLLKLVHNGKMINKKLVKN